MPTSNPPKVTTRLVGQAQLRSKLRILDVRLKAIFVRLVNTHSKDIANEAKKRVAVDMGRLRSSIKPEYFNNGLTAEVGTNVGYGAFVEFGTGPLGRRTGAGAPADYNYGSGGKFPPVDVLREWVWRNRRIFGIRTQQQANSIAFLIGRKISRHGMKAKPFMIPAFEKEKRKFKQNVRREMGNLGRIA